MIPLPLFAFLFMFTFRATIQKHYDKGGRKHPGKKKKVIFKILVSEQVQIYNMDFNCEEYYLVYILWAGIQIPSQHLKACHVFSWWAVQGWGLLMITE